MAQERLNKVMANAGIASRRACDEMIQAGRVTVNGQVVTVLGVKVDPARDQIRVDGELLKPRVAEQRSYLMLYKPAGVLSVFDDPRGRPGLESLLKGPLRLYPVGRLDLDSEGLLLLTDDGDLTLKLSHPRYEHAKSYLVLVDRMPGTDTLAHFRRGIQLDDGVTAPSHWRVLEYPAVVPPSEDPSADEGVWLHVTMHEGRKRQIRRMAAAEKLQVRRLVRVGLGSLRLDRKLRPGESRSLTRREMQQLLDEADAVEPAAIPRRREQSAGPAARGPAGRVPKQAAAAAYASQRRPSGAAAQPSGPRPRGPRREDQPARAPERRPPYSGGPQSDARPAGPRPSGARPGRPRREDQPEREPGRRPTYAGGPKPGPRPAGPRSSGPRCEDQPEREPGRRPPYAGGPKPGPRPAGPRSSGPRREDQPEREPGRRPPYAGGPKPGPRPAGPRSAGPRREDQPERVPRRSPAPGQPPRGRPGGGPQRPGRPGAAGSRRPSGRPGRPPRPGAKRPQKS